MGKIFISLGVAFILVGIILIVFKNFSLFNLPGDIVIKKEGFTFYFPITTSIILSIIFSIIFYIFNK